jgi:hypothetical protein
MAEQARIAYRGTAVIFLAKLSASGAVPRSGSQLSEASGQCSGPVAGWLASQLRMQL